MSSQPRQRDRRGPQSRTAYPSRFAPRLYLVTDRTLSPANLARRAEAALQGGVDAVQLREKDLGTRELLALARELRAVTSRHGAKLMINGRIDVAIAAEADGVHLPANSFRVEDARRLLPDHAIVGVSIHSLQEARRAQRGGADFVAYGPVFETPSKRAHGPPQTLDGLRDVTERVAIPVVAIGGIDRDNAAAACDAGAHGVAVIRAIGAAEDPRQAAQSLFRQIDSAAA